MELVTVLGLILVATAGVSYVKSRKSLKEKENAKDKPAAEGKLDMDKEKETEEIAAQDNQV